MSDRLGRQGRRPPWRRLGDALIRRGYWLGHRALRPWWWLRPPRTRGVAVAVWQGGRILVIRTSYRRSEGFPGGGCRRGEMPAAAAARELAEEVGIGLAAPDALTLEMAFEHRCDRLAIFALYPQHPPRLAIDHREIVSAAFLTPAEALARPLAAPFRHYLEQHPESRHGQAGAAR